MDSLDTHCTIRNKGLSSYREQGSSLKGPIVLQRIVLPNEESLYLTTKLASLVNNYSGPVDLTITNTTDRKVLKYLVTEVEICIS